jgi:hypothetical protein
VYSIRYLASAEQAQEKLRDILIVEVLGNFTDERHRRRLAYVAFSTNQDTQLLGGLGAIRLRDAEITFESKSLEDINRVARTWNGSHTMAYKLNAFVQWHRIHGWMQALVDGHAGDESRFQTIMYS